MTFSRRAVFSLLACAALSVVLGSLHAAPAKTTPKRLLIVTVTKGFRHSDSIPVAEKLLADLGEKSGAYTVDYVRTEEDMTAKMSRAALANYDGVVFASTTGDLPLPDRDGFLQWIQDGHAFIGIHAASDTFHSWQPYLSMVGGEFKTHGPQVWVTCNVEDKTHPATKMLGVARLVYDEIYQFKNYDRSRFHGLLSLDRHPNDGTPGDYPIAWCRTEGKGRVFYTALGHRPDVWQQSWYQAHVLGGIRWALGDTDARLATSTPAAR